MNEDRVLKTIIVDSKSIRNEMENLENEAFHLIKKFTENGDEVQVFTSISAILRAIYMANPLTTIERLQSIIEQVKVIPTFANFKDADSVDEDLVKLADSINELNEAMENE